jgi:hypothetical protein
LYNPGYAAHNKKAAVPWTLLHDDPDKFFEPECLPAGVKLVEISKMKSESLQSCIQHWYKRQDAGENPFHFKHVNPADFRAVQKNSAYTDDNDEEIELPDFPSSPSPTPGNNRCVFFLNLRALSLTCVQII